MRLGLVSFWLLLMAVLTMSDARADLSYSGEQSLWQDTVWEGTVLVDGILTVPPGVTLEIRPGTVVRFTFNDTNGDGIGEHELFIQGLLKAEGSATAPIRFTSAEAAPAPGWWGAINMMASEEDNLLRHCLIEYAYRGFHAHFAGGILEDCILSNNMRALQFQESTVRIERCRIADNFNGMQFRNSQVRLIDTEVSGNHWGLRCVYSDLSMERCRFTGNLVNGVNLRDSSLEGTGNLVADNRKGIYLQRSTGSLRGNIVRRNSEHGILLEDSDFVVEGNRISGNGRAGIRWDDSLGALRGNDLSHNGEYALVNVGEKPVDARENWWGTADLSGVDAWIRGGRKQPGAGLVDASRPLPRPPMLPFKSD